MIPMEREMKQAFSSSLNSLEAMVRVAQSARPWVERGVFEENGTWYMAPLWWCDTRGITVARTVTKFVP